jgi:hypothetical protein
MSAGICVPAVETLEVEACHAAKVARWLVHCGGVAVWGCLDLSDPSRQWFTPAKLTDGSPAPRPHWSAPDPRAVEVVERREAGRCRVAFRPGYGLTPRLTDASARRLDAALDAAGDGACHAFEGGEAVTFAVVRRTPLPRWLEEHPDAGP